MLEVFRTDDQYSNDFDIKKKIIVNAIDLAYRHKTDPLEPVARTPGKMSMSKEKTMDGSSSKKKLNFSPYELKYSKTEKYALRRRSGLLK